MDQPKFRKRRQFYKISDIVRGSLNKSKQTLLADDIVDGFGLVEEPFGPLSKNVNPEAPPDEEKDQEKKDEPFA